MTAIGEYVLEHFFANDVELVRSRDTNKSASIRALVARCDTAELPLSKSSLHNAVSVAAMNHQLSDGGTAFKQLSPSHQVTLLPLRDPKRVERIAERAIRKELSVRALSHVVVEEVSRNEDRETKPEKSRSEVVTKLAAASKALAFDGRRGFTKALVGELTEDQAAKALVDAQALVARLNELITKLEQRI
ncbi:MAG: hypothetical protein HYV07_32310 [Deltaproteobacteria bacterium]|nr:hypothetical protein [Deltaproteobacteria bacterium]